MHTMSQGFGGEDWTGQPALYDMHENEVIEMGPWIHAACVGTLAVLFYPRSPPVLLLGTPSGASSPGTAEGESGAQHVPSPAGGLSFSHRKPKIASDLDVIPPTNPSASTGAANASHPSSNYAGSASHQPGSASSGTYSHPATGSATSSHSRNPRESSFDAQQTAGFASGYGSASHGSQSDAATPLFGEGSTETSAPVSLRQLEREPGADVDDLEEVDGPEFLYYGFVRFILFAIVNPLDLAGCYYQCRYTPLSGAATSFWRRGSHAPSPAIQSSPTVKPSPAQVPLPVDADGYLPESAALALPLPMDSRGADHADRPLSPFKDANAAAAALASSLPQSIFGNLQVAWRQEGFLALFKGVFVGWLRDIVWTVLQPTVETSICEVFDMADLGLPPADTDQPLSYIGITALSNAICAVLLAPWDVVRTRLMLQKTKKYTSAWNCVSTIAREEGLLALYKGFLPTLLLSTVPAVISLTGTVALSRLRAEPNSFASFGVAFAFRMAETLVRLPLQTVRRRLQSHVHPSTRQAKVFVPAVRLRPEPYGGPWHCVQMIVKEEGIGSLWRGLSSYALLAVTVSGLLAFAADSDTSSVYVDASDD